MFLLIINLVYVEREKKLYLIVFIESYIFYKSYYYYF